MATSFLNELNELAQKQVGYINYDELEANVPYKVIKFDIFESNNTNKFDTAPRVRVFIINKDSYVILPQKFDTLLENARFKEINVSNLYIIYEGRDQRRRVKIRFDVK